MLRPAELPRQLSRNRKIVKLIEDTNWCVSFVYFKLDSMNLRRTNEGLLRFVKVQTDPWLYSTHLTTRITASPKYHKGIDYRIELNRYIDLSTGWFTMNDTKTFSNNFYSKALCELKWVPYFHWNPDILICSLQKVQQVSSNFQGWVERSCLNFENMQNT